MSNKILIPLIVVLSLITIVASSLTQLNKSSEKVVVVTSSVTISSVKSQVVSISSTIQTNSSIAVLSAQTSSAQKVEGSKVGSVNSPNLQKEISYDENNIAFLSDDKSKLPKSVIQFLDCPTKFLKGHYGAFIVENEEEIYKCPPKIGTLGCKFNISYLVLPSKPFPITFDENNQPLYPQDFDIKKIINTYKTGWNCDLMYPLGTQNDGGFTCFGTQNPDYNFQYSSKKNHDNGPLCYAIPKSIL